MNWNEAGRGDEFIAEEFGNANLGDHRLAVRLQRLASAIVAVPSTSFPDATGDDAALEATYRFLRNPRVTPAEILAPHIRATSARVAAARTVVVAHDTTEFCFGSFPRGDLGRAGRGDSYGFCAHVALAVAIDDVPVPLGVLGVHTYNRAFGAPRLLHGRNKRNPANTMHRWGQQVKAVRAKLGDASAHVIHVMDREADDYALLAQMIHDGDRFVVRQAQDRRMKSYEPEPKVRSALEGTPILATSEVKISTRRPLSKRAHRSRYPARNARDATVDVRAVHVAIPRPPSAGETPLRELQLHLVHALERNTPAGCEPVEWWLWTTEPIDTPEQVLAIVAAYRQRWIIEEFFKALKTGCAFEKRQLESKHSLLNALAVFVPVAWRLLVLRTLGRATPSASASAALTSVQVRCLRAVMEKRHRQKLPRALKMRDAMLAIAKIGGHVTNNGDPGWIVLGRGFDRLLDIELGFSMALK